MNKMPTIKEMKVDRWNIINIVLSILLIGAVIIGFMSYNNLKRARGMALIELTFRFNDINELRDNHNKISKILTESQFKDYGLNNEDFTYYNYVRTKTDKTDIKIETNEFDFKYKRGNIKFRLMNEHVNINRIFTMEYGFDSSSIFSRIDFVRIYELVGQIQ